MWIFLAVLVLVAGYFIWCFKEFDKIKGCTGDCKQGRQPCNCKKEKEETVDIDDNWPFPTNTKP